MITLQYLEDSPGLFELDSAAVLEKLRRAADRLPISHLLIGWHLPPRLLEACRKEAERLGIRFLRWQPLLAGEVVFQPEHRVVGAGGKRVSGYQGKPEFTFACPNHPVVREAVAKRMESLVQEGQYQGFFLDRLRFPSPARHPVEDLGCFCEHCRRLASASGLDLVQVQDVILNLGNSPPGRISLVSALLGSADSGLDQESAALLHSFLDFREQSITHFTAEVCAPLKQAGMEVGLDCFSPSLTRMVGQNLQAQGACADWIKVMCYAHTLAPAGLPYEILCLHDYLTGEASSESPAIMERLGRWLHLDLPKDWLALEKEGIPSAALESELRRGVQACSIPILAGIELVEIKWIAELNKKQILSDLAAVRRARAAGLSLSWDLWHIPLERLDLVRSAFSSPKFPPHFV